MSSAIDHLPRPARLNFAGWCIICGQPQCCDPWCIQTHARAHYGICDECDGSQNISSTGGCRFCFGGLIEYQNAEAAAATFRRASNELLCR